MKNDLIKQLQETDLFPSASKEEAKKRKVGKLDRIWDEIQCHLDSTEFDNIREMDWQDLKAKFGLNNYEAKSLEQKIQNMDFEE